MNDVSWQIPVSTLKHLAHVPTDRAVVVLLRHSVRDHLPPGDAGYRLPITEVGRRLAAELGAHLRGKLRTLRTSPLDRCVQTAEALAKGAQANLEIVTDRLLGDPGAFVIDGQRAWANWAALGHEGVMRHLVTEVAELPGMAKPEEAARLLVKHMLDATASTPGLHVFVTHDLLVTATAARLLGIPLGVGDWPWFLEGAFFWEDDTGLNTAYRCFESRCVSHLCDARMRNGAML